jgi:hypothetical protein
MFKMIGGAVVYGFALYGLVKRLQSRRASSNGD